MEFLAKGKANAHAAVMARAQMDNKDIKYPGRLARFY